jgi:predicted nucleic acid-binding protein
MTNYCLDANVFIEGWTKYYSIDLCPNYWRILDDLAQAGTIFAPIEVKREIDKIDDGLKEWLKEKPYFFHEITTPVQEQLRTIMASYGRLVDSTKQRSMADPWVIAFALSESATVVTKETPVGVDSRRIKIPDVCEALGVPWIDDFTLARNIGIKFSAIIG